jgi:hypothetical protein
MFEYFSIKNETPIALVRLNYAVETRYGVLVDIAKKVLNGETIDVIRRCVHAEPRQNFCGA